MEKDSTYLTNDNIIRGLKTGQRPCLKILYDDYSPKLLSVISMIVANEEMRLEILKKTFVRISLDIKAFDSINSTVFIWMMRVTISASAECMNIPLREIQDKFWEAYKELMTNNP